MREHPNLTHFRKINETAHKHPIRKKYYKAIYSMFIEELTEKKIIEIKEKNNEYKFIFNKKEFEAVYGNDKKLLGIIDSFKKFIEGKE